MQYAAYLGLWLWLELYRGVGWDVEDGVELHDRAEPTFLTSPPIFPDDAVRLALV